MPRKPKQDWDAPQPISKTVIDAAAKAKGHPPSSEYRIWDRGTAGVRGFGLRVKPSGVRSFFYEYKIPGTNEKVRKTIGQYPTLAIDKARAKAQKYAAQVLDGIDPREAEKRSDAPHTVSALCDLYLERARKGLILYRGRAKKPSTVAIDEGRVSRHIKPVLGSKPLNIVTSANVEAFRDKVASGETSKTIKTKARGLARVTGGHGTAGRCVDLLGSIFTFAIKQGFMDGPNPAKGVDRLRGEKRERYLRADEYKALSKAMDELESEGKSKTALDAFRVLALTGARRNEILALKKSEVFLDESLFEFQDTKTGKQRRVFGRAATALLRKAIARSEDPIYVFAGAKPKTHIQNTKLFRAVVERAKLHDVTPHTLRHSFATTAGELNYAEVTVGALLGHRQHTTTGRYTHAVDDALIGAANRISETIAAFMANGSKAKAGMVLPFPAAAGA
ncbi:tyrosine-type recombinase/integrase [Hwanghaeella sp.]|uniref:tyrosine-type recombinase/integrase n=1 Tax=Hwanghaeella sp. TaxID=2605943 RepID=UPI003CCC2943